MTVKLRIKNHNKYEKKIKQFILYLNHLILFFKNFQKNKCCYLILFIIK